MTSSALRSDVRLDQPWPDLSPPAYAEAVERVMASGTLTEGPEVPLLEAEFEAFQGGSLQAVAVNSGCTALELAARIAGVAGREVIVPALTFSGSVLPIIRAGGIPVFADVDERTFNLTPETVDRARGVGRPPRYVMAVHLHGLPAPVYALTGMGYVIEDACQALGAWDKGLRAGAIGHSAGFSLNAKKTVFAGEGGILMVAPEELEKARLLRHYGMTAAERGVSTATCRSSGSWNSKLPELSAAIARASLGELSPRLDAASFAAELLRSALPEGGPLLAPLVPKWSIHAWHKFRVLAASEASARVAMRLLEDRGVSVGRWQRCALTQQAAFREFRGRGTVAQDVLDRSFIVGAEDRPLCAVSPETAASWAQALHEVRGLL